MRLRGYFGLILFTALVIEIPNVNSEEKKDLSVPVTPSTEIHNTPPNPSPTKKTPRDKPQELLELAVQLAESNFQLRPSLYSRSSYVMTLEKLLDHQCFKKLHSSLNYSGAPTDTPCRETIERILLVDGENPLAICARDGIDSNLCKTTFGVQKLALLDPMRDQAQGILPDLEAKLNESKYQERLKQIENELFRYVSDYKRTRKKEVLKFALGLIEDALNLSCKIVRIDLEDLNGNVPPTAVISSTPTSTPGAETPIPKVTKYRRVRYLTRSCAKFINEGLKLQANFPPAICFRDGQVSPACIGARRLKAKQENAKAEGTRVSKPGSSENEKPFVSF